MADKPQMKTGLKPTAEQIAEADARKSKPVPAGPDVSAQQYVTVRCWNCGAPNVVWWGNSFYCWYCGMLNAFLP